MRGLDNRYKQAPRASYEDMRKLHCEPVPDDQKVAKAIEYMDKLRKKSRSFVVAMEACTKCGLCAENCHTYLGTRDPNNIPTGRADLMRKVYKRYFTPQGRMFGKLVGAEDLTLDMLEKWYSYYYQCNECRRCAEVCPFGIDTCEVTMAGRQILHWLGMEPKLHNQTGQAMEKSGNHMGFLKPATVDTLEFMADECQDEFGATIRFPVDEPADILYVPSSADFAINPYTLMGAGMFFNYIGASWTIASSLIEAGNFGFLFDQEAVMRSNMRRLVDAVVDLGIKKVVWGECGHGWRSWKMYMESTVDRPLRVPVTHLHDEVAECIRQGKLLLDPTRNDHPVTLHDPCNYGRACGLLDNMRLVMQHVVTDFREMTPNRQYNFCCGGGSGILFDDPVMYDLRVKFSRKKAEQVRATHVGDNGEGILCAPCSICKAQLYPMVKEHELGVEVKGLIDLVGRALVWK